MVLGTDIELRVGCPPLNYQELFLSLSLHQNSLDCLFHPACLEQVNLRHSVSILCLNCCSTDEHSTLMDLNIINDFSWCHCGKSLNTEARY